jgi:signal transduction histidine kinase
MKLLSTTFLFLFFTYCFSQSSTQVLTADMFSKDSSIKLSNLDGWIFKPGNDAGWADTNLNTGDWKKLKPADFTEKMLDENGKIEGWFRLKIKLDSSLQDSLSGIGLKSSVWAASDVYIDGKLFHSFGNIGLNNKPFKENYATNKLPILFPVNTNKEYLIAIHFSDKINQFDFDKKLRSSYRNLIIITSPHYANQYYHNTLQDANMMIGVSVFLLTLALLFWLIYFQNKEEKHLLAIALTVSFLLLSWIRIYWFFDSSFSVTQFLNFSESFFFILYFSIVPFTVGVILNKRISNLHWIFASILFIVVSICYLIDLINNVTLTIILSASSGIMAIYYIISARQEIKGARWAVVIGLILNLSYTLLLYLVQLTKPDISKTFITISLVFALTIFPVGLLVYVSMWFKETRKVVEQNAQKILQIIEEKKVLLESQNIILEKQVSERTRDLNLSLENLRSTQSQLIQSEKMASLGELTAGIAHEIQNPLNFVNNFSEVNNELLEELKEEADKGNIDEVKAIANDIIDNSQKINQHGKRADAIVKGMLQHSRSSSGIKEQTDINKLADEYLRLAYHGLRAKDKSFNATLITDYDETIGKINIIPQDMGRVILNLITNAFYATNEKQKSGIEKYEPTVWISTKKNGDAVEISVKDNGNGIPQTALDKIFQPFFTTKPTGQGTGLGLSLAYDIVKAHGGELKVTTEENVGTEFNILLPIKNQ